VESVSEGVGGDGVVGPSVVGVDPTRCDEPLGGEEPGTAGLIDEPVVAEVNEQGGGEADPAGLVSLAASDVDQAGVAIDVMDLEGGELGDTQAGVQEQDEDGVCEGVSEGSAEEAVGLFVGQGQSRGAPPVSGPGDAGHDLGSTEGDGVEEAEGGVVDDSGGGCEAAVGEVEEKGADCFGAHPVGRAAEEAGEAGDVADVVGGGARGEVAESEVFGHLLTKRSHGAVPSGPV